MELSQDKWLRWITALQGIAQTGLTYCKDVYDRERYEQLRQLTCEMTALPELSTERITAKQIALLFDIVKNNSLLLCD